MAYHIFSLALPDESFPESGKVGIFHVFFRFCFWFSFTKLLYNLFGEYFFYITWGWNDKLRDT